MGCYQNGSEQTSTTGQQQYPKCQYLAMIGAAGATGAAETEEGRRTTTWTAVSHWKSLQVTWTCTNMLQRYVNHLHVNAFVGAQVLSTDAKSWIEAEEKQYGPTSSLHRTSSALTLTALNIKEPLNICLLFAVTKIIE